MGNLYKYVGNSYIQQVFAQKSFVTLKCTYPKSFNDPYELFLAADFDDSPEALALFRELIGELPQIPTTCFSRSPIVVPMWAHYAENHRGFVIELNESKLAEVFPRSGFGDVDYRDGPDESLNELLHMAYERQKPRYVYMLQNAVFSAAYYTKLSCWQYEQERRMLVGEQGTRTDKDLILMDVPKECVTGLFCGPQASKATVRAVRRKAKELGCRYLDVKIGKTAVNPFFLDDDGSAFIFSESAIEPSNYTCSSCREPIKQDDDLCSWCQISGGHTTDAARRNPYRMLHQLGLLDGYIQDMREIGKKHSQKEKK